MPFPMKIQPIDGRGAAVLVDLAKPPPAKSRLKRLFERQFPGVLRTSYSSERIAGVATGDGKEREKEAAELEPSSVCLAKMVQNFMEEGNDRPPPPPPRCGRNRCNCFNGNCDDSSEEEFDFLPGFSEAPLSSAPFGDASDILKSLVPCPSTTERNLLADTSRIVEKNSKICCGSGKGGVKGDCRRVVADGLVALGYDASICRSRWEKSPSFPAGDYEYIDVVVDCGERLLVDIDFRSEFEIARSTKSYQAALQTLPVIFVGPGDRLQQIVAVVSEAARQSLKKKGLHFPPWRKPEYMLAKWLSPYQRIASPPPPAEFTSPGEKSPEDGNDDKKSGDRQEFTGELELGSESSGQLAAVAPPTPAENSGIGGGEEVIKEPVAVPWQPPAVKPKVPLQKGAKVVTGLASIDREIL